MGFRGRGPHRRAESTHPELALLDKSFLLYEHALRWQDYDLVISFHKNEHEKLTEAKRKQLKKYRVTSYEVVYTKVESDHKSATRVVEIKYYNEDYARSSMIRKYASNKPIHFPHSNNYILN